MAGRTIGIIRSTEVRSGIRIWLGIWSWFYGAGNTSEVYQSRDNLYWTLGYSV